MDHLELLFQLVSIAILAITIVYKVTTSTRPTPTSKHKAVVTAPQPSRALPVIGHLHLLGRKDQPVFRTMATMADKCGPIFSLRLGKCQAVVVNTCELVKECFITNDAVTATRPNMAVSKYIGYDYAAFFIAPYGPYWRDMRKFITKELLSSKRLEDLKHVRAFEVNSFMKNLHFLCMNQGDDRKGVGLVGKSSLDKWFENVTFNLNFTVTVGKRFSASSYDDNNTIASRFKKAIALATYLSGVFVPSDFIPFIECFDFGGHIRCMKDTHKEIELIIGDWLEEHIKKRKSQDQVCSSGATESDFIDVMLSSLQVTEMSGHATDVIIKATTLVLLLTGSGSTSITLTWAVSLLLNHPNTLMEAHAELDALIGKQRWVEESDIKDLPYLQAIVKETFRLYPPSPFTGPREAMKDCHIGGYFVPKGTRLLVNIWKLHRDPRVWSNPNQFQPERFLDDENAGRFSYKGQCFEYIPFSAGRRACPGVTFGLQIVHLILARLLQGFDISTNDGMPVDMSEGLGIAMPKVTPLDVVLKPRLPTELYQALQCQN